ncbi:hypothetical protein [Streptomyces sp. NPDC058326]
MKAGEAKRTWSRQTFNLQKLVCKERHNINLKDRLTDGVWPQGPNG